MAESKALLDSALGDKATLTQQLQEQLDNAIFNVRGILNLLVVQLCMMLSTNMCVYVYCIYVC